MKALRFAFLTVLALLAAATCLWAAAPESSRASRAWEHLALEQDAAQGISTPAFARQINQLGDAGWELVTVTTHQNGGSTTKSVFYFKRPKS